MSKLYYELVNIIDFVPDKEEEQVAEKFLKTSNSIYNYRNSFPVLIFLFVLFLYCFGGYIGCILFVVVLIVFLFLYRCHHKKYQTRMSSLVNKCIFNKALTHFMVFARYVRKPKEVEAILPAIGNTLCNLGRFEEAERVAELMKKYCDTPVVNMHRISLCAAIARYKMDKNGVEQYTRELEMLIPKVNTPYITKLHEAILKYPMYMEVEESCDYARAEELLKEEPNDSLLKKVSRSYRLCKIAMSAGLDEKAEKHGAFVLENGGDTFYRRELEGSLNEQRSNMEII